MDIYIHRGGEDLGPFTPERVSQELTRGHFGQSDFAWHEGLPDWVPLNEIVGLAGTPASSPDSSDTVSPSQPTRQANAHIFVVRNGTALGPFTVDEVKAQMQTGIFSTADIAKHGGSDTLWPLLAVPGIVIPPPTRSEDASPPKSDAPKADAQVPAGFWIRFAAYWVDALVMYLPHLIIASPFRAALLRSQGSNDLSATADVALTGMGILLGAESQFLLELAAGTELIEQREQVRCPAPHGSRALRLRAKHGYHAALRFVAKGGNDEIARHCSVLVAAAQDFACLDEQVTFGMVLQSDPFGGPGFGNDDLACGSGVLKGEELDRGRSGRLLP